MKGFIYPLAIANSGLVVSDDYPTLVAGAIMSSLNTAQEERVFRPEYGNSYEEFQSLNSLVDVLANCRRAVELGLEDYPEVTFEILGAIGDDGLTALEVIYICPDGIERTVETVLGAGL